MSSNIGGPVTVRPLTPERWPDLVTLFGGNGACAGCWDMYYRISAKDYNAGSNAQHAVALRHLVEQQQMPGLLAYRDGEPAGWCALGPPR